MFSSVVTAPDLIMTARSVVSVRESHWHTWTVFFSSALAIAAWVAAAVGFKLQERKGKKN